MDGWGYLISIETIPLGSGGEILPQVVVDPQLWASGTAKKIRDQERLDPGVFGDPSLSCQSKPEVFSR